ncbi:uncharacterized protein L201_007293 [Kwoniella dendrophila CBS 6074]|uniref:Uncharacterized protein n=1 Tax=Kwoniella dendrophila CBS 6074 TaxID=1295534 RepID=A0AAX4K4M0_9TREE
MQHLSTLFYQWCQEGYINPRSAFIFGSVLDSPSLAALAIRNSDGWRNAERYLAKQEVVKQKPKDHLSTTDYVPGYNVIDPMGFSFTTFNEIPQDYLYALCRATSNRIHPDGQKVIDWNSIADDFMKVLKLVKGDR